MSALNEKVHHAISEGLILMSVVEVMIGFGFNAFFQTGFDQLPPVTQSIKLGGLGALLVAMGLMLSPVAYHRIVTHGEATEGMHRFTTVMLGFGLLPMAAGSSVDVYVVVQKLGGAMAGVVAGVAACAIMFFCWYGFEWIAKRSMARKGSSHAMLLPETPQPEDSSQKLKSKIDQVLEEARMVLPGAQALLGFQFIAILTSNFDQLPQLSKLVHLASQGAIGLSVVLLMTPAAYHRIVEGGESTEHFCQLAQRLVVLAMVPLALGVSTDLYVVATKVSDSSTFGLGAALAFVLMFLGLWYGYPYYRRRRGGPERLRAEKQPRNQPARPTPPDRNAINEP